MRPYTHFAVNNLYLFNGFSVEESEYGEVISYEDEAGLEQCIRLILALSPKRLNGRELRFLRRGLGLSQESFGLLIDRDAQTVARIEKSLEPVSRPVDLIIRVAFFKVFRPHESVDFVSSLVDETSKRCSERIILSRVGDVWTYKFDVPRIAVEFKSSADFEYDNRMSGGPLGLVKMRLRYNLNATNDSAVIDQDYSSVGDEQVESGPAQFHLLEITA